MGRLEIKPEAFFYDGSPITLFSGAIHYFRVVPEYWRDRLQKLKACGLNTVETYIPWSLHEPRPGHFCFGGMADFVKFVRTAEALGLFVLLRPSPYICSEYDFGGLPSWLLSEEGMRVRCSYQPFLDRVDAYYDVLIPKILPLLSTHGGPVIALQVENEYGSYGNDQAYLRHLKEALINRGVDVPLFTSDGPVDELLQGGTLKEVYKTVNFGSSPENAFKKLRAYQTEGPLMCMEFWVGWFEQWGEKLPLRDADDVADVLDRMLQAGASVNFYMFHGGTNFGFCNGALMADRYLPAATSYDYGALLDESGDPTEKYDAVNRVLLKQGIVKSPVTIMRSEKMNYGKVNITLQADLFDALPRLSKEIKSLLPEPMEKYGQDYGFILYSTWVSGPRKQNLLEIQEVHDRAVVLLDRKVCGIIERGRASDIRLDIDECGAALDILVENMGRINYGPYLEDPKGITAGVRLDHQFLYHWRVRPLPLNDLSGLSFGSVHKTETPAFYKAHFMVGQRGDTYLNLAGWHKGVAFLNGFNLGRYWEKGPQKALYVPGPLLHCGENELVVFEIHGPGQGAFELTDTRI